MEKRIPPLLLLFLSQLSLSRPDRICLTPQWSVVSFSFSSLSGIESKTRCRLVSPLYRKLITLTKRKVCSDRRYHTILGILQTNHGSMCYSKKGSREYFLVFFRDLLLTTQIPPARPTLPLFKNFKIRILANFMWSTGASWDKFGSSKVVKGSLGFQKYR